MKGKSFLLELNQLNHEALPAISDEPILWDKRLDHYYNAGLQYLQKNQLVLDLPKNSS
uniref:Uncharacterized protein n=1 Tax=Rhizophora mucronata TaxID=61149 RepID=A0A2P2QB63_RHIMU